MRSFTILTLLLMFLSVAAPAFADEATDYILNDVREWTEIAQGNNFNILGTYTGRIGSSGVIYNFELSPGIYHFYSSGGMNIQDLDLTLYDKDGNELNSDAMTDKIPIVVVKLDKRTELEANIAAWSFKPGYSSELFCLLLTAEDDGEIMNFSGQTIKLDESESVDIEQVELSGPIYDNLLAETGIWIPFEADQGREVYQNEIVAATASGHNLTLNLDPGFYNVYAQPDPRCSDLDISVYDEALAYIAENHLEDNFPECSFYLAKPQKIEIDFEVAGFEGENTECFIAYMVSYISEVNPDSMNRHINDKLESLRELYSSGEFELVGSGFENVSEDNNIFIFELELGPGNYTIEADGGMIVMDLDMTIYDHAGTLVGEDSLPDNYPLVNFELNKSQTLTFEISVFEFAEGYTADYFCWALAKY